MDKIYHEKQEGSLCAVHCINSLIQSAMFSAVDLAGLASQLDSAEEQQMAVGGTDTDEYQNFIKEGSNNMDDSGMFSVQVITEALKIYNLTMDAFVVTGEEVHLAQSQDCAYICNMREHWFTIRKIGQQWFNLNSLLVFPELVSDTYLSLFLAQLQIKGYTIYSVKGTLPICEADDELLNKRVVQAVKPPLLSELSEAHKLGSTSSSGSNVNPSSSEVDDIRFALAESIKSLPGGTATTDEDEDQELARAMAASLESTQGTSTSERVEHFDDDFDKAIQLSLNEHLSSVPNPPPAENADEEDADSIRQKRLKYFEDRK